MVLTASRSWLHRRRWQVFAVLAFGGPLVAIALVQYRWLEELDSRSQVAESQQNRVAVMSVAALLEDRITGTRLETLPPAVHQDVFDLKLDVLGPQFDEALERFPYVKHFFLWVSPSSHEETLFYFPKEKAFGRFAKRRTAGLPKSGRWTSIAPDGRSSPFPGIRLCKWSFIG